MIADYDGRECVRQKFYYMTLLALSKSLPLAGGVIPSQEPQVFYKLLLRGEKAVAGMGNKLYATQWNALKGVGKKDCLPIEDGIDGAPLEDGGEDFFAPLHGGAEPKRKAHHGDPSRDHAGGASGSGRGVGVTCAAPITYGRPGSSGDGGAPPGGDPGPGSGDAGGRGGDGVGGDGGGDGGPADFFVPLPDREADPGVWATSVGDMRVRYSGAYVTKQGKLEPHWVGYCNRCPKGCHKRRGIVPAHERVHGEIEPLAFLHAWHDMEWPSKPTVPSHPRDNPTPADVTRMAELHRDELLAVCRAVGR